MNRAELRTTCLSCGSYITCCPNCHDSPIKVISGEQRFYCGSCCNLSPHRDAEGCLTKDGER